MVGEVKWKERVKREEVRRIEEKFNCFDCRRILVVLDENVFERKFEGVEVLMFEDLVEIVKEGMERSI